MYMRRFLLLFLALASFANVSIAQSTGGIEGRVSESQTANMIGSVGVLISPNEKGTTSNADGYYSITGIAPGTYKIKAQHLGFLSFEKEVTIIAGKIIQLDIQLKIDMKELLAVEIRDDKIQNHAYSKAVIKESTIEQRPVRDIGDFLREVPNLYAVRKGGANLDPVIRGFKFSQLNVQVDNGLRMEGGCPNRMDPTTAHVEAGDIEAIEVLKGPFALRYGPVMGGVINMLTATPRPFEQFQIHVKANMGYESNWHGQRQHLTVFGGGKRIFFTFSGNNSIYADYTDGDGNLIPSHFTKFGYIGKLGFALAKNHTVTFAYSEFYARNVAFSALPMDERTDNTKLYSFDYSGKKISKTIESLTLKAYLSDVEHVMDNLERGISDTATAVASILAQRMGYRAEAGVVTGKNSHLFVGTDMYQINKDGDRVKTMIGQFPMNGKVPVKIENLWNKAFINNYGVFGEYRHNKNLWEVVLSSRLDFNSASSDSIALMSSPLPGSPSVDLIGLPADSTVSDFVNFSFSAGLSRKLNEFMSIGVSFGRGVRSPDVVERFIILLPTGYDNFEYLGNPLLLPETNNEFDVVYKYNNFKFGSIELSGFYSIVQNYIGGVFIPPTEQKPLTANVLGVKQFENIGTANIYGFEFTFNTPTKYKWNVNVSAAYTAGTISEVEVLDMDANGKVIGTHLQANDNLGEIPPLNFNLNFSYPFANNQLVPKLHFRYSSAQNNVSESMQELTTEAFSLIDFSLLYKHNSYFSVVGGVNNILDNAYFEHLNRRVLGTNSRIYEPGRVFFVNLLFNI